MKAISVEQGDSGSWSSIAKVTPGLLKGLLNTPPCEMVHLPVPDAASSDKGMIAVKAIDDKLHSTPGRKVLVGNSTGCAYITLWARQFGATSGIDPADLHIVLLANPERKYGGWTRVPKPPWVPWNIAAFGTPGFPDGAPWEVTDFAQRYDLVADCPSAKNPDFWATAYALTTGLFTHMNYYPISPNDPGVLSYVEGNTTYLLSGKPTDWLEKSFDRPNFTPAKKLTL